MSDSPIAPETQPETIHLSRPWGHMEQYALNTHASVKIVTVNAGAELSLQYHHQRAELWVMLDDGLVVELDGKSWEAKAGEEIWIPVGMTHRLRAPNNGGRLLEVAFGDFDEADIVRLSDRYGRGGMGVKAISPGPRGGRIIASFPVASSDQIMLATSTGQSIRVPVDQISFRSRSAGGVKVFNIGAEEEVVSVARVAEQGEDDEA